MNFQEYQEKALGTDQIPKGTYQEQLFDKIVPLLGLTGEAGELLSEYKKHLRDGSAHILFKERIAEELGDLLWYISNLASKFDLSLDEIAKTNLEKVQERWLSKRTETGSYCFDKNFPEHEKIPRQFEFTIKETEQDNGSQRVQCFYNNEQIGDYLTDNSRDSDGYRFHDVFHFAYAAILGWSPVTRKIMSRKRKSDSVIDEVEDGGRATAIEEGVAALVFSYAESHNFLKDISTLDYSLLKTIVYLTSRLEVGNCSTGDWEKAILVGYEVWRKVYENGGGKVIGDIDRQTLIFKNL